MAYVNPVVPKNCKKVMVVDNDRDTGYSLKLALQLRGLVVDAFDSPRESLSAFEPGVHRVALVDLRMREMSGFELARELWGRNPEMQVCFLTGFQINSNEVKKVLPSLKDRCFLKKPMDIGRLATHIQSHLTDEMSPSGTSGLHMDGGKMIPCTE